MKLPMKLSVSILFGFRLLCFCAMAGFTVSYRALNSNLGGPHTVVATATAVWAQVVLGCSLISASIPILHSFLKAFLADGVYRVYDTRFDSHASGSRLGYSPHNETQRSKVATTSGIDPAVKGPVGNEETGSVASDASRRMMIEPRDDLNNTSGNGSKGSRAALSKIMDESYSTGSGSEQERDSKLKMYEGKSRVVGFRPDLIDKNQASVKHEPRGDWRDHNSGGSQENIIRQTVTWEVSRDTPTLYDEDEVQSLPVSSGMIETTARNYVS